MTKVSFGQLFSWELANIPRRPLFWLMLVLLAAGFIWGALNVAALHKEQTTAIAEAIAEEKAWYDQIKQRVPGYAQKAERPLKYWQDPTDISGFSRYFLREYTYKPHLPISELAVGQSDLLPYLLPVKLETLFGVETKYDFEHPRGLALGLFDLGFCIIYLLPIAIIVLVTMIGAFERDHGILRLAAAQAVSPRMLLGTRMLALGTWFIPGVMLAMLVALAVAGAPIVDAFPDVLTGLTLTAAYAVLWMGLGFFVLTLQGGAAASASALVAAWALFGIVTPLVASFFTSRLVSTEVSLGFVDEMRTVTNKTFYTPLYDQKVQEWLDKRPEPQAQLVKPASLPFAAHLPFLLPEQERQLADEREAIIKGRAKAAKWTPIVEAISPPVAVQSALSALAGTDPARHELFTDSIRAYQLKLRNFIYPRIQAQVLNAKETNCEGCGGKMTFTDFDNVPKYEYPQLDSAPRIRMALTFSALFLILGVVLIQMGRVRGRAWRAGELD